MGRWQWINYGRFFLYCFTFLLTVIVTTTMMRRCGMKMTTDNLHVYCNNDATTWDNNDNEQLTFVLQQWCDDVGWQQISYSKFFLYCFTFLLTKHHCYATTWNDNDDGQLILQQWHDDMGWQWQWKVIIFSTTMTTQWCGQWWWITATMMQQCGMTTMDNSWYVFFWYWLPFFY